ncbi:MAG TPA: FAD-binding oxidoreductase [Pyrinomonadaceae bacterium]|jgi:sarcosine oxidase subunit beta|nr:FAD-binding oxidoreductase [Pyrinomonadaceae bacterium]
MSETSDVVIIGGGIIGSSVAYHLALAGCANVIVVERGSAQGLGSTGRATGGVRAQFSTPINIQMSLYSIEFLSRFKEATGRDSGYKPYGYLFVATNERQLDYLKETRERQRAAGLNNVEIVSPTDIASLVPGLRTSDLVGGSFCQTDGLVEPLSIMRGFMERASERGVRLWLDTKVIGIEVERGRVCGVQTTRGRISTRAVVNASGAWAASVARLAGVEIPVVPLRRQLVATRPFAHLPEQMPMVIDMADGFHFRRDPQAGPVPGVLMAWPDPLETPGFKTEFDRRFIGKVLKRAIRRAPCLAQAVVEESRCRAGLYEMTPDHHAIIGEAPNLRGLFLANGFSGHGVMHSPATGRLISELILYGETRLLDVTPLSPARFTEGRLLEETSVL